MTKNNQTIEAIAPNRTAKHEHKRVDIAQIREIAGRYIEAAQKGKGGIFEADMLASMRIQGYLKGAFVDISTKEFVGFIDQTGPLPELKSEIEQIEVIGTAAILRIDCENWNGVHFSDFMNLLKIDGTWKVAGKVFEAHENR